MFIEDVYKHLLVRSRYFDFRSDFSIGVCELAILATSAEAFLVVGTQYGFSLNAETVWLFRLHLFFDVNLFNDFISIH